MSAASIAESASREVHELHGFFVGWFRGAAGEADFAACEAALAPDFRVVAPDGGVQDRATLIDRLKAARGSVSADFRIEIPELLVAWQTADAALIEYVERQYRDCRMTDRRSTALFTRHPAAPRGVVWRHLQETWTGATKGEAAAPRNGSQGRGQ